MSPFNFPSSVVQKVVAIGIDFGAHIQPIAQEPSGFFFDLESVVTNASPEVFTKIFRVSFGREREAILAAALPSGDNSLCRGRDAGLPPLPSAGVSLALPMGTTLGEVTSLCFFIPVGFRIPCPSTAMFMPMYGGADT